MFFGTIFILWIIMIIVGMGMIVVYIFYLLTQSRILELCHPHTRTMNPGEVWMVFIPLFGIVWHFIMIGRIADSLAIEFRNRNIMVDEARPGYNSGLTAQILRVCTIIPLVGIFIALVWVILLLMYWSKMRGYKNMLEQHNAQSGGNPFGFQQAMMQQQHPMTNYPPQNRY
jgi:hypothetical protein